MLLFDAAGHATGAAAAPARAGRPARRRRPPAALAAFARRRRVRGGARPRARRPPPSATPATAPPPCASSPRRPPATALDRSATHRRAVGFGITSLDDVRAAGHRHGATVNDVLLAASTVALGARCAAAASGPPRSRSSYRSSTRGGDEAGTLGQPHLVRHGLAPARRADPDRASCARVRAAHAARKTAGDAAPGGAAAVADLLPGRVRRVVARAAARAARSTLVVSNVPGPPRRARPPRARADRGLPRRAAPATGTPSHRRAVLPRPAARGVYADADVVPDAADIARDLERALRRAAHRPARARRRRGAPAPCRGGTRRAAPISARRCGRRGRRAP